MRAHKAKAPGRARKGGEGGVKGLRAFNRELRCLGLQEMRKSEGEGKGGAGPRCMHSVPNARIFMDESFMESGDLFERIL